MTEEAKWVVPIIDIDGELGFEIPDDLLEHMELSPGDTILWEQLSEYSWSLTKEEKNE